MVKFRIERGTSMTNANVVKSIFWEFDVLAVVGDDIGFTISINTDLSIDDLLDKIDTCVEVLDIY